MTGGRRFSELSLRTATVIVIAVHDHDMKVDESFPMLLSIAAAIHERKLIARQRPVRPSVLVFRLLSAVPWQRVLGFNTIEMK